MAGVDHLSSGQFDIYRHTEESIGDVPGRSFHFALNPHDRSGPMGMLSVHEHPDPDRREVDEVWVDPAYRRSGPRAPATPVADALYEAAGRPAHSPHRTAAGDAWARRVGGEAPPRSSQSTSYDRTYDRNLGINAKEYWREARSDAMANRQAFPGPPTQKRWY